MRGDVLSMIPVDGESFGGRSDPQTEGRSRRLSPGRLSEELLRGTGEENAWEGFRAGRIPSIEMPFSMRESQSRRIDVVSQLGTPSGSLLSDAAHLP